jgi:hypothetical protein
MLADAIVNWFERNKVGRRSFYDKKRIEAGDFIKEPLRRSLGTGWRSSRSFIWIPSPRGRR